jgi:hypothetical protein
VLARFGLGQAAQCLIPRHAGFGDKRYFDPSAGIAALDYLKARTREDPFFALASGLMHAGPISYGPQQRVVEGLVADPERERLLSEDPDFALRRKHKGAQMLKEKIKAWPYAMDCWDKWCRSASDPKGKECLMGTGRSPARATGLMGCLIRRLPSGFGSRMGRKSRNLMAEYLGCDLAVAADRHVGNWLSTRAGTLAWSGTAFYKRALDETCKGDFEAQERGKDRTPVCLAKGRVTFVKETEEAQRLRREGVMATDRIGAGQFAMMKREMQRLASGCGLHPAELQVGAWLQSACEARGEEGLMRAKGEGKLWLGTGSSIDCKTVPGVDLGPPPKAWELSRSPRPLPMEDFRCRPGYFGQVQEGPIRAQPVNLLERIRFPAGKRVFIDPVIRPVVPPERLSAWIPGFRVATEERPPGAPVRRFLPRPLAPAFAGRRR